MPSSVVTLNLNVDTVIITSTFGYNGCLAVNIFYWCHKIDKHLLLPDAQNETGMPANVGEKGGARILFCFNSLRLARLRQVDDARLDVVDRFARHVRQCLCIFVFTVLDQ